MIKNQFSSLQLLLFCIVLSAAFSVSAAQTCLHGSVVPTTPLERFTKHGNGTVTDRATALMWQRCSMGQDWQGDACINETGAYSWQQTLQQVERNNLSSPYGYNDWRLPNIKELASIIEKACADPAINTAVFSGVIKGDVDAETSAYWSSTYYVSIGGAEAWYIDFADGDSRYRTKPYKLAVRLVRNLP